VAPTNKTPDWEASLVDKAVAALGEAFPPGWTVERSTRTVAGFDGTTASLEDVAIDVRAANGVASTFAVEVKRNFTPRDAEQMFVDPLRRSLRALGPWVPILVVTEWLSPRSRALLETQGINYLDTTGNVLVRMDNPMVFIRSEGAARDPRPTSRGKVRLRGPKAARVIRLLADVRPPYGVREMANASGVAVGYVATLFEALDREALIERSARGRVESVDVSRLLRRWAVEYDVFTTNETTTYLAPAGASRIVERLRVDRLSGRVAISGSFAAVRLAPVAAPSFLVVYCEDQAALSERLGLLPADEGANVALLKPFDSVVWRGVTDDLGLPYVAPSQTAVDCLTGNGRMPAEGEAVLKWMQEHEAEWRLPSLSDLERTSADLWAEENA
jgi:hypothetical protein